MNADSFLLDHHDQSRRFFLASCLIALPALKLLAQEAKPLKGFAGFNAGLLREAITILSRRIV